MRSGNRGSGRDGDAFEEDMEQGLERWSVKEDGGHGLGLQLSEQMWCESERETEHVLRQGHKQGDLLRAMLEGIYVLTGTR